MEILKQLRKAGLYLKRKKYQFHKMEVKFLGIIISYSIIYIDPMKIKTIMN